MKKIWTYYLPSYPKVLLYMLQSSEYKVNEYLRWSHRTRDFTAVMKRRQLAWTSKIKLLAIAEAVIVIAVIIAAWFAAQFWIPLGLIVLLLTPVILAYAIVVPLWLGEVFIQNPKKKRILAAAHERLKKHPAKKIAIAGSYGKTTTKEVLRTVLSEKFKVAATPGNMNTPLGTSRFSQMLDGDEEVLIFELGETHMGDISELCELIVPDIGVITGINQAHLETFGTIENTIKTIFELQDFLGDKPVYKNVEDAHVRSHVDARDPLTYDNKSAGEWLLDRSSTSLAGTELTTNKASLTVHAKTKLIGDHMIGTLLLAVEVADSFGLTSQQIIDGLARVAPFEHRMEPRLLHGAWLIDDTYNGNIRGVEAGLALLKKSDGKRKIYVTPGLVEQGNETEAVHKQIGKLIAQSADVAVLMRNSVTEYISEGLHEADFKGQLQIVDDPLEFYTNIEHFIAAGDVVLMQNDWTDNYA